VRISTIKLICARYCRKAAGLIAVQQGQALPIVLAMVGLGAIVTGPFLSMASASVIGSRVLEQSLDETCAAGAGVEQAIWQLEYGTLAAIIPNTGDSRSYALTDAVNNLYPQMMVTRSSAGGGGGSQAGTITRSIIDTLQFDTAGNTPLILNLSGNIFAVVYHNSSNRLNLKTLTILADGTISNTVIDSLTVATTGYEASVVPISSSMVAIAYRGPSNKGYVATVGIDSSGNIGSAPVNNVVFANNNCYEPEIVNVGGTYYAVVYRGPSNKGYINTLEIASSGIVTNTVVSTYNNLAATCYEPDIAAVTGGFYAIVYRGASNRGYLATVTISASGVITQSVTSSAYFNSAINSGYTPRVVKIAPGVFATVYRGVSNRGNITTSLISDSGVITNAIRDTWVFDNTAGYEPCFLPVSGTVYGVVYRGNANDGYLKTIDIDSGGTITQTEIDSYRFDTSNGYEPDILYISGNIYGIAYRGGTGSTGYVKTIGITTAGTSGFSIQATAGNTTITADVQIDTGIVKVLTWQITN
jgi:hypothetical protein